MSHTKMINVKVKDIKPRCGRCGKTRNVRTIGREGCRNGALDLCTKCLTAITDLFQK